MKLVRLLNSICGTLCLVFTVQAGDAADFLLWRSDSFPMEPGKEGYLLEISRSADFNPSWIVMRDTVQDAQFALPSDLAPGVYHWRVRHLATGSVASSHFSVQGAPLPLLQAFEGSVIPNRNVLLQWLPVPGAYSYRVELSYAPDFKDPMVYQENGNSLMLETDLFPRKYYWRVSSSRDLSRFAPPDSFVAASAVWVEPGAWALASNEMRITRAPGGWLVRYLAIPEHPARLEAFSLEGRLLWHRSQSAGSGEAGFLLPGPESIPIGATIRLSQGDDVLLGRLSGS